MASVIHIAEVAALLALAYVFGWAIGYVVKRLTARPATSAAVSAERLAVAMGETPDALVKAPVIVPVANEPPPAPVVTPVAEPVVEVAAAAAPLIVSMEPPVSASRPALPPVVIPPIVPPPPMFTKPEAVTRPVEPTPEPEPVVPFTAAPAARPGEAWTGEIKGRAAQRFDLPAEGAASVAEIAATVDTLPETVTLEEPALTAIVEQQAIENIAPGAQPEPLASEPPVAEVAAELVAEIEPAVDAPTDVEPMPVTEPELVVVASPAVEPAPVIKPEPIVGALTPPPPPVVDYDEDAAMRAIEGGWSRVRARAMPGAPELADVGAAVAAAQTAVEQVLARAGIDPKATAQSGKPKGLPKPRASGRDNLKSINGLSPLDESTLNNLGVYHFDQIGGWDETEVLWMENHVFARGRIGREDWQGQARTLASVVTG